MSDFEIKKTRKQFLTEDGKTDSRKDGMDNQLGNQRTNTPL